MACKPRRFDDGGDVREDRNENISDDIRERALAFARRNAERGTESMGIGDSETMATPKVAAPRPASRMIKPARDEFPAETKRFMDRAGEAELRRLKAYDKPLEAIQPEMMLPSGRVLQGIRGLAQAAARKFAPESGAASAEAGKRIASRARDFVERDRADAAKDAFAKEMRKFQEQAVKEGRDPYMFKKGGKVKKYAAGGSVTASRRADGIAQRGKTKGRIC